MEYLAGGNLFTQMGEDGIPYRKAIYYFEYVFLCSNKELSHFF